MGSTLNIGPYSQAMREQGGWEIDGDSRAGGVRTVFFKKQVGLRTLELQLWGDGKHRVSHMICGQGTTNPSDFGDVAGMIQAIDVETKRRDWKPGHEIYVRMTETMVEYLRDMRTNPNCAGVGVKECQGHVLLALRYAVEEVDRT